MSVLCETPRRLRLRFAFCKSRFSIRPIAIRNLAMDLNISGLFLKRYNIDQLHSQDALLIHGRLVPLHPKPVSHPEVPVGQAVVLRDVVVPPLAAAFVPLRVLEVSSGAMPAGDGLVRGGRGYVSTFDYTHEDNGEGTGFVPAVSALVRTDQDGCCTSSVVNAADQPLTLAAGSPFGSYHTVMVDRTEKATAPWRICMMREEEDGNSEGRRGECGNSSEGRGEERHYFPSYFRCCLFPRPSDAAPRLDD